MSNREKTEDAPVEKQDNVVAAKLRVLEAKVSKIVKILETMFGVDINQDGKIGMFLVVLGLSALTCFAQNKIWSVVGADGNDAVAMYDDGSIVATGTVTASATEATYTNALVTGNHSVRGTTTLNDLSVTGAVTTALTANGAVIVRGATTLNSLTSTGAVIATSTLSGRGASTFNTMSITGAVVHSGTTFSIGATQLVFSSAAIATTPRTNAATSTLRLVIAGTPYFIDIRPDND